MASKIFLDANVLLDLSLKRTEYSTAKKLYQRIIDGEYKAFVTPSIVHIIAYWLKKAYGYERTKEIILDLLTDIKIIDCDHATTINALNSNIIDIEDSLQYYAALYHKLDFFITRDKQLLQLAIPTLPAYSPDEFLLL